MCPRPIIFGCPMFNFGDVVNRKVESLQRKPLVVDIQWKKLGFLLLRKFQQTPGKYPRYLKIPTGKDCLHKQVVEGLGYVPGVCWNFLRLLQR